MACLNPTISVMTLTTNALNTAIKRSRKLEGIKKTKSQLYAIYKTYT